MGTTGGGGGATDTGTGAGAGAGAGAGGDTTEVREGALGISGRLGLGSGKAGKGGETTWIVWSIGSAADRAGRDRRDGMVGGVRGESSGIGSGCPLGDDMYVPPSEITESGPRMGWP